VAADFVNRDEHERSLDRVERRFMDGKEEILRAVSDLKASMNGQFARQGEIISRHDRDLGILQDRSGRDNTARVYAAIGGFIALVAGYLGFK